MFYIKQYLPTLQQTVSYKELTNAHYFDLLKYINNSDDRGIADCFNQIIESHTKEPQSFNCLERFLILFDIRSICIGDSVELQLKSGTTAKLSIFSIIENIKQRIENVNFTKQCVVDDIILNLNIPRDFIVDKNDDIYESIIESIVFDNKTYLVDHLTIKEKGDFYKSLPASVFFEIISYIKEITEQLNGINLISKNVQLEIDELPLAIFDNTLFTMLKLLYKDDLMNFYEQQYSFIRKMQFTQEHFMQMTPNESRLFINLFNKDLKSQEDAQNKNNSGSYSGPLPGFASV